MDLGLLDSESTLPRYHECQYLVKMNNFKVFSLNLGKLPNYLRWFGSNNVEGVAESWVEAEISWMELGGDWYELGGDGWSWVHSLVIPYSNS